LASKINCESSHLCSCKYRVFG